MPVTITSSESDWPAIGAEENPPPANPEKSKLTFGLTEVTIAPTTIPGNKAKTIVDTRTASQYVDLTRVRERDYDYLSLLSSNTRQKLRRAYRRISDDGPLVLTEDVLSELASLHEAHWQERQANGAFNSEFLPRFHRRLVRERFGHGEIQLIRVSSNDHTVGCLYNFVYRGRVYYYQSGFNYALYRRSKPGLLTHVEAIVYNARQDYSTYEFLGGRSQYKMSLSTDAFELAWVRVQQRSHKLTVEHALARLKRRLSGSRQDEA